MFFVLEIGLMNCTWIYGDQLVEFCMVSEFCMVNDVTTIGLHITICGAIQWDAVIASYV